MGHLSVLDKIEYALEWARAHLSFEEHSVLRSNPWSTTILLHGDTANAYLKVIDSGTPKAAKIGSRISKILPDYVPKTIAFDQHRNLLLMEDHGGSGGYDHLGEYSAFQAYANLQYIASENLKQLKDLAVFDWGETLAQFRAFSDPIKSRRSNGANLSDYVGFEHAALVSTAVNICHSEFSKIVKAGKKLEPTLEHCDFHSNNYGVDSNDQFKFHDWDNALIGPPGLSLGSSITSVGDILFHHFEPRSLHTNWNVAAVESYAKALSEKGFGNFGSIIEALPGNIIAGLFNNLVCYANVQPKNHYERMICTPDIERLTGEILDCCTLIASRNPKLAIQMAELLSSHDLFDKMRMLLGDFDNKGLKAALGPKHKLNGKVTAEINLIFEAAAEYQVSQKADTVPSVSTPWVRSVDEKFFGLKSELASQLFSQHGCLVLENAFPKDLLNECRIQHLGGSSIGSGKPLQVGDARQMEPVQLSGAFNSPDLLTAPFLMEVLASALGEDFVLGSATMVTSKPGAKAQHLHIDHPHLFSEQSSNLILPPHAITVLIPLVDIDNQIGGTEVMKGSHLLSNPDKNVLSGQSRTMTVGSCLLFDYRLYHRGLPNTSNRERPVLSLVYQRPWFCDAANFHNHNPLQLPKAEYERIPDSARALFAHATII